MAHNILNLEDSENIKKYNILDITKMKVLFVKSVEAEKESHIVLDLVTFSE